MIFNGYYTGFADEAGADLETQIRATRALGWSCLEARNIGGRNIHDLSDAGLITVQGKRVSLHDPVRLSRYNA